MLVAFSVAPTVGADDTGSLHEAIADVVEIVRASGIANHTDSMFTTLEGEWDECMEVVRRCCDSLAASYPRVSLVLKADIRPGHSGELTGKVERVEAEIARRAAE
ncbi:MAG: thiamine-binding protein [Dermatophilus congolensis]|nr:thiamine-binding protein [Dermatophilus congolensis]